MDISSKIQTIYDWFNGLHTELIGRALEMQDPANGSLWTSAYPKLFLTTFVISFIVAFAYYIWPIDHPRFKAWWSWLIMLAGNCGLCLLAGWHIARTRMYEALQNSEKFCECISRDSGITENDFDCFGMGLTNVCVSVILFIFISLFMNWFSVNAKYSPMKN